MAVDKRNTVPTAEQNVERAQKRLNKEKAARPTAVVDAQREREEAKAQAEKEVEKEVEKEEKNEEPVKPLKLS